MPPSVLSVQNARQPPFKVLQPHGDLLLFIACFQNKKGRNIYPARFQNELVLDPFARRRNDADPLYPAAAFTQGRPPLRPDGAAGTHKSSALPFFGQQKSLGIAEAFLCFSAYAYFLILDTTPEPTVLPPSRIAKRRPSSTATGLISETSILTLSPGMTISTPSSSLMEPVTSVVRMKN